MKTVKKASLTLSDIHSNGMRSTTSKHAANQKLDVCNTWKWNEMKKKLSAWICIVCLTPIKSMQTTSNHCYCQYAFKMLVTRQFPTRLQIVHRFKSPEFYICLRFVCNFKRGMGSLKWCWRDTLNRKISPKSQIP